MSMACEAARCFSVVFQGTKSFRSAHVKDCAADPKAGLEFWKQIRPKLEQFDSATASWGGDWPKFLMNTYAAEDMEEKCPEYDSQGAMIEPNHFMLQVLRIPTKETLTLRELCQVALNLGQLSAHRDEFVGRHAEVFDMMMARSSACDFTQELDQICPPPGTAEALCRAMGQYGVGLTDHF
eukprot:TRINITY_DN37018_c0_g1_i1.p1 TRINITY_DN37018_c0_g1~~TRINITY_DN37018_c0_g1_i1.p1  ORF type:complete len:181 (-),score=29.06 TRINITY_DN37018_c0_g1_i1:99-641(-)